MSVPSPFALSLLTIVVLSLLGLPIGLAMLVVVRAAQSVGAAAALSVSSALIRSIYPVSQLGRGLSVNIVVVSVGNGLAPALGGLILEIL